MRGRDLYRKHRTAKRSALYAITCLTVGVSSAIAAAPNASAAAVSYTRTPGPVPTGATWSTANAVTNLAGWTNIPSTNISVGQVWAEQGSLTSPTAPIPVGFNFNYGGTACSQLVQHNGVVFCVGTSAPLNANGPAGPRDAIKSGFRVTDGPWTAFAAPPPGNPAIQNQSGLFPMDGQVVPGDFINKPNLNYAFAPMYAAPLEVYGGDGWYWCYGPTCSVDQQALAGHYAMQRTYTTTGVAPNRKFTLAYRVSWTRRNSANTGYTAGCATVPNSTCFYEWQLQLLENGGGVNNPFRYAYRCSNCLANDRPNDQFPWSVKPSVADTEPYRKAFMVGYELDNTTFNGVYCAGLTAGCLREQNFSV